MIVQLMTLLAVAAPGDPPVVRYAVKVETRSWEPIAIKEVERFVEAKVKAAVSKTGAMRLEKASFADIAKGEYKLAILGRFVEEAERFSVYLSFGPGTKDDVPSFYASATSEELGRKKRSEMQRRIEEAAERAGKSLAEVVGPRLKAARLSLAPPPLDATDLPVHWGDVEVPSVKSKTKAIRDLLNVENPNHIRQKALVELKKHAYDQQPARNAIERCVLFDPMARLRASCVRALEPVARAHVPTQRILLAAMRTDVDDEVLSALTKVSKGFVGLSRLETISTWLHMVASETTPHRTAGAVAQLIAKEENVPNLDVAVAACLQQEIMVPLKRYDCGRYLLRRLPPERRLAAAWKYLHEARVFGTGERLAYEAVLDEVAPRGRRKKVDPRVGPMLLDLAERRELGYIRHTVIFRTGDRVPATPESISRLLSIAYEQKHADAAIRSAVDVAMRDEGLITATIGGIEKVAAQAQWLPQPHRGDPYEDAAKAIDRLQRRLKRKKRKK